MSAQLFPTVKGLQLVVSIPVDATTGLIRDDLIGIKVWYSTVVPDFDVETQGTLAYEGDGLNVFLPDLNPATTYYVKYALISFLDEEVYDDSETLTGVPLSGVSVDVRNSNPVTVVPAFWDGTVLSFEGTGTTLRVYEGGSQLEYDGVGTSPGTWKIENSFTNITVPEDYITDSGSFLTTSDIEGLSEDKGSISFTITGRSFSNEYFIVVTTQTIAKSRMSAAPSIDIGGVARFNTSYDGSTYSPANFTVNAIIANIENPTYLWAVTGASTSSPLTNSELTITPSSDSINISLTVDGSNLLEPITKTIQIAASYDGNPGPSIDISGVTGFNRNVAGVILPNTTTLSAVTAYVSNPVYTWEVINGGLSATDTQSVVLTPTQTSPITVTLTVSGSNLLVPLVKQVKMVVTQDGATGQVGASGTMSAFPTIYQWTTTSTPPSRPTTTSTYTWSTGEYAPPVDWFSSAPSNTTEGSYLWTITVPLVVSATTSTSTLDWTNVSLPIKSIAYNGANGEIGPEGPEGPDGPAGQGGSATFVIIRSANDSGVPTSSEVISVIGRNAVAGDIATVTYNDYNASVVYKYTTSWSLFNSYITGSLIVQNTITADNIVTGTITAESGVIGSINADTITAGTITGRAYQTNADVNSNRRITINNADNNQLQLTGALGTFPETYGRLANIGEVSATYTQYISGETVTTPVIGEFGRMDSPRIAVLARTYRAPAIYIEAREGAGIQISNPTTDYPNPASITYGLTYGFVVQSSNVGISIQGSPVGATNKEIWYGIDIGGWGGYFSDPIGSSAQNRGFGIKVSRPKYTGTRGWNLIVDNNGLSGYSATGYGVARIGGSDQGGGICFARDGFDLISARQLGGSSIVADGVLINADYPYTAITEGYLKSNKSRIEINKGTLAIDVDRANQQGAENHNYIINHTQGIPAGPVGDFPGLYISAKTSGISNWATGVTVVNEEWGYVSRNCYMGTYMQGTGYDHYAAGTGANYGPFTGSHDGLILKDTDISAGDIVIDKELVTIKNTSNSIFINEVSGLAMDKRAVGVHVMNLEYDVHRVPAAMENLSETKKAEIVEKYTRIVFNAVGEGIVNVCKENGNIEAGDLICTSNTPGKGMRQPDDLVRNYTVARARNSIVWDNDDNSIKQVACIYLCG